MKQSGNMNVQRMISRTLVVLHLFFQLCNYVDCLAEDVPETEFCNRFVRSKGYLCEEHKMYTEDGFELLLHRVRILAQSEGGSDNKQGDIQYNLKVALSHRMRKKDKSTGRLTSEVKRAESSENISEVHLTGTVSSERAQPFQPYDPDKTQSRSEVDFPAVTIDPQLSNAQPLETVERTLLPTTSASNPYTTFDPLSVEIPTPAPILSKPDEAQFLSPEASTEVLPPLWYIPGVTQPPVQSELSDLPVRALPADGPSTSIFSPELPPDFVPRQTFSPAPSGLKIPGELPEPIDQPQPSVGPVVPDPTTISTTAPSPYLDPLVPPSSPKPIEWVAPPLGAEGPASSMAAAPVEEDKRCRPVLLLHHELLNGDMWFTEVNRNGSSPLLPFLLADDGFDVWVGHERATYWSHDHTRLDSSKLEYWDWTWDEFVDYDLPIMLSHINANTHSKVHVVGVSQSAAVAVAASTQQAVASRMKSLVLLGPTIYHGSVRLQQSQTWAQLFAKFVDMTRPDPSLFLGQFNISRNFGLHNWSLGGPVSLITGPDCCISKSVTLFHNGWDGTTSYKNFQHFEQGVLRNTFERFDYVSASRNLEAYGQTTPPAYSPASIPVDIPVQVIFAGNDFFSPPEGVEELFLAMPKLPAKVYLRLYAHFDLLFSSRRHEDVYFPILSFLRD